MTKTVNLGRGTSNSNAVARPRKEPRPFLYLEPISQPVATEAAASLADAVGDQVPALVRALVNHTIALQNRRQLETGRRQPISLSVLNRRRRCARTWIQAILAGATDSGTLHAVAHSWIPQLVGSGPDLRCALRRGRSCIEYLRGAITAVIFDRPAANLLPEAVALHALETALGGHLRALRAAAQKAFEAEAL